MRVLGSLLTGLATAPLLAFALRLCQEATATGAAARILLAVAIGGCALLAAFVPARRVRGRTLAGAVLVLAGGAGAVLVAGARPPGEAAAGFLVLLPALGLRLIGGARLDPGPVLLGAAAGLLAGEELLRHVGYPFVVLPAAVLLVGARLLATRAAPAAEGPSLWLDLAVAGLLLGFHVELTRPFALQHVAGTRFSQVAFAAVLLFGGGLAALLRPLQRPRPLVRAGIALLAVAALAWSLRGLRAAANPAALADVPFTGGDSPRLGELATLIWILGLTAVAGGCWLGNAWRGARTAPALAVLFLALAGGGTVAERLLGCSADGSSRLSNAAAGFVRNGPHEVLQTWRVTPDGVLRVASDPTQNRGAPVLRWHGAAATRAPEFAGLEEQEVRLAGRLAPAGGRLLLVGNVATHHRQGIARSPFTEYEVAATLPVLETPALADEARRDPFHPDAGAPASFDAVVVLSAPALAWRPARLLTAQNLAALQAAGRAGTPFLVWFDLRSAPLQVVAAVARALVDGDTPVRAWLALDGFVAPFLALETGPLPPAAADAFSTPFDAGVLAGVVVRANRLLDPVAETLGRAATPSRPLPAAADLEQLAALLASAGAEAPAHLVAALAVHAAHYGEITAPADPAERDVLTAAECDLLVAALAAEPSHPLVLNQVRRFVQLAYAKREYELLDRVLLPAIAAHPDDVGLRYMSGRAAFDLLDHESAVVDLETAVRGDRLHGEAYLLLGRAYAGLEDWPAAISALESARTLRPDDLEVLRFLGLTLWQAGRAEEARTYLERVVLEDPGDREARACLERIRSG